MVAESLTHFNVAGGVCPAGFHYAAWAVCFGLGCLGGIRFLGVLTIAASGEGKRGD